MEAAELEFKPRLLTPSLVLYYWEGAAEDTDILPWCLLTYPSKSIPIPLFDPHQDPDSIAALRVNDVLDVVMQSDVIPALVGLDMEGHLAQTEEVLVR